MSTLQTTTVLEKIRSRGYWRVVIRPTIFEERRVPNYGDLFPIVEKNSVQLRGWDYPHIDHSRPPLRGEDWVGQEYDCEDEIEVWRLYLSGQFAHVFAMAGDWGDCSSFRPAGPGWHWGRELYYLQTIYSLREIYEFAARLALSPAGAARMRVEVEMHGLKGRRLATTDSEIALIGDYRTQAAEWKHLWEGSQTELIARPLELAASAAQDFFARFGLNVSVETLLKLQQRMAR
jgi:hypothetical protein